MDEREMKAVVSQIIRLDAEARALADSYSKHRYGRPWCVERVSWCDDGACVEISHYSHGYTDTEGVTIPFECFETRDIRPLVEENIKKERLIEERQKEDERKEERKREELEYARLKKKLGR